MKLPGIIVEIAVLAGRWQKAPGRRENSILTRGHSIADELATNGEDTLVLVYLAMRATEHQNSESPAVDDVVSAMTKLAPAAADSPLSRDVASELCRAGGGELHNVSSATGGMVAQELIKIITKQFIPVDNTCVFDGIRSRCQVFRL